MQYNQSSYYQTVQPLSLPPNAPQETPQPLSDPYANHFYSPPLNNQYNEDNQQTSYGQSTVDNGYNSFSYGDQQQQQPQSGYYQPENSAPQQSIEPSPYDQQYEVSSL